jgi:hypothetical protein
MSTGSTGWMVTRPLRRGLADALVGGRADGRTLCAAVREPAAVSGRAGSKRPSCWLMAVGMRFRSGRASRRRSPSSGVSHCGASAGPVQARGRSPRRGWFRRPGAAGLQVIAEAHHQQRRPGTHGRGGDDPATGGDGLASRATGSRAWSRVQPARPSTIGLVRPR